MAQRMEGIQQTLKHRRLHPDGEGRLSERCEPALKDMVEGGGQYGKEGRKVELIGKKRAKLNFTC